MHGRTYKVGKNLYDSMQDIMAQTHRHQATRTAIRCGRCRKPQQAIAKGGPSYATINGSSGQVTKF